MRGLTGQQVTTRAAESESESAGVSSFDRSRSRYIFIDSDSCPQSESVTALFHYFLRLTIKASKTVASKIRSIQNRSIQSS